MSQNRCSKRKRNQVSYYEGVSDGEDSEVDSQDVMEYSAPKKRAPRPPRPLPKRKLFPFLELPAEIRNAIYGYCLVDASGIHLAATTKKYRRTVERTTDPSLDYSSVSDEGPEQLYPQTLVPSLLAVNKQIHQEGRDILYSNEFRLQDPLTMHSFLVDIGPRAATYLKHVTLVHWGPANRSMHKGYNHSSFAMLALATNLNKFRVEGTITWGNEGKQVARQMYRDGFPWLEAVGAAKGRLDAAVDVIELCEGNFSRNTSQASRTTHLEKNLGAFRAELRKLLHDRMEAVRAKPGRPQKKASEKA
ncbi:hypothetical protein BDV95DRAFT_567806 [Massariosphaeria phaeospora]|uniref:DUF7730 domain-containing protein n=1 Tax=Massariosphaeria phaeospora TaxID=100035 RepID=A0A7C8I973_9PLEO|nr:hypothetical protein BDV95DRAFT_567806 [Massariosphaeria phaeospora]